MQKYSVVREVSRGKERKEEGWQTIGEERKRKRESKR